MRGFTLVEILIVTAITIILIAASFPIYENFQRDGKLDVARIELQENLKNVQAQAQAGVNDSSHGVISTQTAISPIRVIATLLETQITT